jgi:hypothetical protein
MERDQEGGKGGAWKEKEEQGKTWKMIYMSFLIWLVTHVRPAYLNKSCYFYKQVSSRAILTSLFSQCDICFLKKNNKHAKQEN